MPARVRSMLLWLLAVAALISQPALVSTYSKEENIEYVEKILSYLNNNFECTLPTFEEVDKLRDAFEELAIQASAPVDAADGDYELVQRSLLSNWDSFKKTWNMGVIVRSAKRRSFLCKIEDYQMAKFGSSVCTRIKDIRGPLTDHIFEKNPLVRYLKHLETGEVIERPPTEAPTTELLATPTGANATTEASATEPELKIPAVEPETVAPDSQLEEEEEKGTPAEESATEEPSSQHEEKTQADKPEIVKLAIQPDEKTAAKETPAEEQKTTEHHGSKPEENMSIERPETGELTTNVTATAPAAAEQQTKPLVNGVDTNLAHEETQMNDVKHNSLEYGFKVEFAKYKNDGIEINVDVYSGDNNADDESRDPLVDIPVPASDDKGGRLEMELSIYMGASSKHAPEPEVKPEAEAEEPVTTSEPEHTTKQLPMFDEHGAEYIEAEYDDARLDQLVSVPKKDWEFDPIYGYFKWPDESNTDALPADIQLDDSYLSLEGVWAEFTANPYAYDERLEAIRRTTTTTRKPKFNAARLLKQKNDFLNGIHDESRRAEMFGWDTNDVPKAVRPFDGPIMPEVKRDRWLKLADNNYCKLGFNQGRIVDSTKSGFKAVKSYFKGHGGDALNSRRRLLSRQ